MKALPDGNGNRRRLFYLSAIMIFSFALFSFSYAQNYTLCSSGCDYSNLSAALFALNNTNNTLFIISPGNWSVNGSYYYNVSDPNNDAVIVINSSNTNINFNNSQIYGNNSGTLFSSLFNLSVALCTAGNYTQLFNMTNITNITILLNGSVFYLPLWLFNVSYAAIYNTTLNTSVFFNDNTTANITHSYINNLTIANTANAMNNSISLLFLSSNNIYSLYSVGNINETTSVLIEGNASFYDTTIYNFSNNTNLSRRYPIYVHNSTGNAFSGANVTVKNNSNIIFTTLTDSNGYALINLSFNQSNYDNIYDLYVENVNEGFIYALSDTPFNITLDNTAPNITSIANTTTNTTANIT